MSSGFQQLFKGDVQHDTIIRLLADSRNVQKICYDPLVREDLKDRMDTMRFKAPDERAELLLQHIDDRADAHDIDFMVKIKQVFAKQYYLKACLAPANDEIASCEVFVHANR